MTDPTMHPSGSPEQPAPAGAPPTHSATAASPVPPPVHRDRRKRSVGWQSKDVLRASALIIGIYVILRLLWVAHELFFVVFLGTLFGLAVASAVDRLERFRIPRGIGAAMVVIGFLAILGGFGAWMAPTLRQQSRELRVKLPEAVDKVESWINTHQNGLVGLLLGRSDEDSPNPAGPADSAIAKRSGLDSSRATSSAQDSGSSAAQGESTRASADSAGKAPDTVLVKKATPASSLKAKIGARMGGATRYLFPFLTSTLSVFGGVLLMIFLSVYIGAEPTTYRSGLMHLFPQRTRKRADEVLAAMAVALRKWLVTQLIAMAVIGAVTTIVLLVLKVKAAFALGLLAGLFEFIPTIGPILSAVPAIAMGFLDSPEKALFIGVAYIGIQFLENHILIPLLMRGGVDLPPALTVISQALMALVFGFIGLMV
ncbi:MAG TPA: AI-2E family transporter, partial [Gemmatimonadaceae bacterium]|nr:AI-2E family transporter [Gemmatimonadaceae bacterium]